MPNFSQIENGEKNWVCRFDMELPICLLLNYTVGLTKNMLTMRYRCRKHQIGLPVFTFGAEERLLASVLAHVRAQSAGVGATVLTVGALEGSLARVSPHMTLDTAPVRSLVVTVRTQVRLLACMSAHMLC